MEVSRFFGEKRISIAQAGRMIANLRGCDRPAIATTYRWCQKGLRNVRLEHAWVGGKIVTSEEAVRRFIEATDRPRGQAAPTPVVVAPNDPVVDPAQTLAACARVEEFLAGTTRAGQALPPETLTVMTPEGEPSGVIDNVSSRAIDRLGREAGYGNRN